MAVLSLADAFQAAQQAGLSVAQSVLFVATATFENPAGAGVSTSTSTGNGGGLLQFEPGTWQQAGVSCSPGDPVCQFSAAKSLVNQAGGSTYNAWYHTWFVWENQQSHVGFADYLTRVASVEHAAGLGVGTSGAAAIVGGVDPPGSGSPPPGSGSGGPTSSTIGFPWPSLPSIPNPLNSIGSGIQSAGANLGKMVLPWLVMLAVFVFALFMLAKELGNNGVVQGAAKAAAVAG